MDNITHTLTGLMLARAGLNRLGPYATPVLLVAANTPDLDVVSWFGGTLTFLDYHRWLTHSLLLWPFIALIPLLLVRPFARAHPLTRGTYVASLIGVLSHLLLDWTNSYGIRLLAPASNHWFRLDAVNVYDFWLWAVLALAILAPLLSRLVSSEIGARPSTGRGWAIFALLVYLAYVLARLTLHDRAVAQLEARTVNGSTPRHVAAFPNPRNPLQWDGLVETDAFFALYRLDLLRPFDPTDARLLYKPEPSPALTASLQSPAVRRFLQFAQFPYWRAVPAADPPGASEFHITDLRFGAPAQNPFTVSQLISRDGHLLDEHLP